MASIYNVYFDAGPLQCSPCFSVGWCGLEDVSVDVSDTMETLVYGHVNTMMIMHRKRIAQRFEIDVGDVNAFQLWAKSEESGM